MVGRGKRKEERSKTWEGAKGARGGWIFLREGARGKRLAEEKVGQDGSQFRNGFHSAAIPQYSPRLSSIHPVSLRSLLSLSALLSLHERTNLVEWISFIPASQCSPRTRGLGRSRVGGLDGKPTENYVLLYILVFPPIFKLSEQKTIFS